MSLGLAVLSVIAGVFIYRHGLPYEGSALVYMGGGISLGYPYYSARYTIWMTSLVMMSLIPVSIWLQNKGVEADNWVYRPRDTYWFWITKSGEGWWHWTKHAWLGNDMPTMEYIFYPVFSMFQICAYSLYSHLLPDHWFEEPKRALKWIFPVVFPLLFAGFISLQINYGKPGKTDYLYWMVALGHLMTGTAYLISEKYRIYTRTPAYWIWFVVMGAVCLTFWEFFHSCINHDWVYDPANSMPFAYVCNGAGIPYTSFFGYLTTSTTFQALLLMMTIRFGHIVIKDRSLVPFARKKS